MKRLRTRRPTEPKPDMLTEGNDHLGRSIWAFSIPAVMTCPGMTIVCTLACYALNFLFMTKKNLDRHERQFQRAQADTVQFAKDMILEIRFKRVKTLRVHVAGDFFSEAYIRAWLKVVHSCPRVTFLAYTRSWRVPDFVPALLELAALPNMWMWWSEDRESGPCRLPGGRRAFLCYDPEDLELVPQDADLVFRTDTRRQLKWVGAVWVCPKEQGGPRPLDCVRCRQCFVPGPMPRGRDRAIGSRLFAEPADG